MAAHKNHQKEEYKRMRAVVFWLHNNTCFFSGVQKQQLDCHHLDHDSTNNSIFNLVPVTNEVHKLLTKSKEPYILDKQKIVDLLERKILHFKKLL